MKKLFTFMLFLCAALTASADDHEWKIVGAAVGNWTYANGVTMEKQADGTFKATTAGLNSEFKIVRDGTTWFGYTSYKDNEEQTVAQMQDLNIAHNTITLCDGANMWLRENIDYVLTLDATNADAPQLTIVPKDGWKLYIKGDFNNWGDYLEMTKEDDGIFRYKGLELTADKQFAFVDNLNPFDWVASENTDSWYELHRGWCYDIPIGNGRTQQSFSVSHDGTWTIEFDPTEKTFNAICTSETYGVVGDEALLGSQWENDIALAATSTKYVYSATVADRALQAGTYKYKMRTNGIWSRYDLPSDTDNEITIPYDGTYTLTFKANLHNNTFTCEAVPTALSVPVANAVSGTQYLTYGNLDYAVSFAGIEGIEVSTVTYDAAVGCTRKHDVASKAVPANTAVVLFKEAGFTEALTLPVLKEAANLGDNDLKVSDGNVNGAANIFCLSNGAKGLGFYPVADGVQVPANKAYLQLNLGKQGAPAYVWFNGETTGIDALENGEATAEKAGAIYTLDGRRVNGNLSQGLYIQNGKKFVVK